MRTLLLAFLGGLIGCSMLKAPSESHIEFGANGAVSNSSFPLMVGTRDEHGVVQVSKHALDVNPATPWQWASVTKQFIAVLVMQDVEAGRLALSDTLAQRLPRFSKDREDVTVEHLLRHFSGLGKPEALPKTMETDPLTFCDLPVQAKPGAQFDYNNCDTAIAAAILEEVNGKPWAELLEERILKPLGMNSSGVLVAPSENGDVITSGAPHLYGASAAMYGSMEDLLAFDTGLMSGALLSKSSLEVLWDGRPKDGFVALGAWEFEASLQGCAEPVRIVERRGDIADIQVINVFAPELNRSVAAFTREPGVSFGEIWQKRGASYELASHAFCN